MIALRVASLIHNARNRLQPLAQRLHAAGDEEGAAQIENVGAMLALAMSLYQNGRSELEVYPEEVDLVDFLADLSSDVRRFGPSRIRTEVRSDLSGMPYPVWLMDRQLVELALLDVLMNAWRHARQCVQLDLRLQGGMLCCEIRDDGPGFPASRLAPVSVSEEPVSGTGKGLVLAAEIAARHVAGGTTGRIELSNDSGAIFRLFLP